MEYIYLLIAFLLGMLFVFVYKKYTKYILKKSLREDLVFWEEVDGHKIYIFKDLNHIPVFREMLLRLSFNQMGLGVTTGDLQAGMQLILDNIDKGNISKISSIANHILLASQEYGGYKAALQLGGSCIIVDDEPLDSYSEKHMDIKRKLVENEEVRFFFIKSALAFLNNTQEEPNISLTEEFFQMKRLRRDLEYMRLIGGNISENLWKLTTNKYLG